MAPEGKRDGLSEGSGDVSIAESIRKIAADNARANLSDDKQLLLFLKSWWSKTYNRPLKDPLLLDYTLEELLYEFYDKIERHAVEIEREKDDEVKLEEAKDKENLDWAEKMEQEELAEIKAKAAADELAKKEEAIKKEAEKEAAAKDPTKDPENIKWMEEQIKLAKQQYGHTFGEDIEENFE
jgi:hypothetical protein